MSRPLRKHKLDGTPYFRRDEVEAEIQALAGLSQGELERRAGLLQPKNPDFVSPEALLYLARNAGRGAHREKLIEKLLLRLALRLRSVANTGGDTVSLTRMNIRDDVRDHFVDILLGDVQEYDDRLDYYEVNFNHAVAVDRRDANARNWKQENRTAELETEDGEVSTEVDFAASKYDPFDADELDKKDYRQLLDGAIDSLPDLHRRIIVMLRQEIPIESKDPSVLSISKVLGRSEKSIRMHRDKAYASLRLRLERKGKM